MTLFFKRLTKLEPNSKYPHVNFSNIATKSESEKSGTSETSLACT